MKGLIKFFKAYLRDEEGQTAFEYVMLLAVAALIVFRLKGGIEEKLNGVIDQVFGKIGEITDGF